MSETAYDHCTTWGARLEHAYGPRVHLLSDPWSLSVMARLSSPEVRPPTLHRLLETAYRRLAEAATERLPTVATHLTTRMTAQHPGITYDGPVLAPRTQVVLLDIARAGMIPAYVVQQHLLEVLDPDGVRIDHMYMQRVADAHGRVTGVDISGSKIGGPVAGRALFVPDPMAATGSSMTDALEVYERLEGGPPATICLLHLVVTPEYLRRVTTRFPTAHVYALRLDRGLSAPEVLRTVPGTHWDEERGLNDHSYIVPGAGGMGELINNAFV